VREGQEKCKGKCGKVEEMAICQRGWDNGVVGRNFNHCAGGRDKGATRKAEG